MSLPSAPTISLKCWVYLVWTLVLIIVRKSTVKRQNHGFRLLPSSRHDFLQSQARGGPWATGSPKRTPDTPQAMGGHPTTIFLHPVHAPHFGAFLPVFNPFLTARQLRWHGCWCQHCHWHWHWCWHSHWHCIDIDVACCPLALTLTLHFDIALALH